MSGFLNSHCNLRDCFSCHFIVHPLLLCGRYIIQELDISSLKAVYGHGDCKSFLYHIHFFAGMIVVVRDLQLWPH